MRTHTFFSSVDATVNQTSASFEIDCGKDMRWLLQITKAGTDGNPHLIIEESLDETIWLPLMDYDCDFGVNNFFLLDDSPYAIRDSYFMGKYIRVRLEPNDNTTGTVTAVLGLKTKSN